MTPECCISPYLSIVLNLGYSLKSPRKLEKLPVPGLPLTTHIRNSDSIVPGWGSSSGSEGDSAVAAKAENHCWGWPAAPLLPGKQWSRTDAWMQSKTAVDKARRCVLACGPPASAPGRCRCTEPIISWPPSPCLPSQLPLLQLRALGCGWGKG